MAEAGTQGIRQAQGESTKLVRLPLPVAEFAKLYAGRTLRAGDVGGFFDIERRTHATVPFASSIAVCGFPSAADDYLEPALDLHELLIGTSDSKYILRVKGDSMIGAGIFPGDRIVVDKAGHVADGVVIVAVLAGEFTIKRYRARGGKFWLQAENPAYPNILLTEESEFQVWAVVEHSIHKV